MKKEYSIAIEKLKELRSIICKTNLYVMDSNEKFYTRDDVLFSYIDKTIDKLTKEGELCKKN